MELHTESTAVAEAEAAQPPGPPCWLEVARGLEMTVEFFTLSALEREACLLGLLPNNLKDGRKEREREKRERERERDRGKE